MAIRKTTKGAISGSFNDLSNKIRSAVNDKFNTDSSSSSGFWVADLIPDTPITAGKAIFESYQNDKYYEVPFTVDSGNTVLGDANEVEQQISYEAVKYARAEGSYEYIKGVVQDAIQQGLSITQYAYVLATYPDHVAVEIMTEDPVTYNCNSEIFNIPYT
ncbi:MAG: hypothetical protein K8E24_013330, partial [Methanobacterium paludis]|nr:hypothetical protein [Methanobacterium paludis]